MPIVDNTAFAILFPVRIVLSSLSGSLMTLNTETALLFFRFIKKSNRVLLIERKAVSDNEKKADTRSSTKNRNSMKMIVVFEKCIEPIMKIPSNSFISVYFNLFLFQI